MKSIRYIDEVIQFDSTKELNHLIKQIKPDIMVIGSDWKNKEVIGKKWTDRLMFFDRVGNYSTTNILKSRFGLRAKIATWDPTEMLKMLKISRPEVQHIVFVFFYPSKMCGFSVPGSCRRLGGAWSPRADSGRFLRACGIARDYFLDECF